MNGSRDGSDGRSLQRIEQELLADDPAFVHRLRQSSADLVAAPLPPVDLQPLLSAVWGLAGAIVLLSLAAGSLVGAAGTCLLVLVLHRRASRESPRRSGAPPSRAPRGPGRSAPAQE